MIHLGREMANWILTQLTWRRPTPLAAGIDREADVPADPHVANSRATGGDPEGGIDSSCTTGTGPSEAFVGRISGDDAGSVQDTGAEVRASRREVPS